MFTIAEISAARAVAEGFITADDLASYGPEPASFQYWDGEGFILVALVGYVPGAGAMPDAGL